MNRIVKSYDFDNPELAIVSMSFSLSGKDVVKRASELRTLEGLSFAARSQGILSSSSTSSPNTNILVQAVNSMHQPGSNKATTNRNSETFGVGQEFQSVAIASLPRFDSNSTSTPLVKPKAPLPSLDDEKITTVQDILKVFRLISVPAFAVCYTYATSLAVFPPVIVDIEPTEKCTSNPSLQGFNQMWISFLFILWNLFDFLGRYCAERVKDVIFINSRNIWKYTLLRSVLVILIMFCNIKGARLPHIFVSDAFPVIFLVALSFTNGLLANLAMMYGPSLVSVEQSSLAGTIMVFFLIMGLFFGSAVSFILVYVLQGYIL